MTALQCNHSRCALKCVVRTFLKTKIRHLFIKNMHFLLKKLYIFNVNHHNKPKTT